MLRVRNQRASKARSPYAAVPNGTNTVASSSVLARGRRGNRRGGQVRQPVANISNINAPPTQATPPTPAAPTTLATQASTEAGQGMSRSGMIGMIPHNMPPIVNPTPDAPSALSSHVPTNMHQGTENYLENNIDTPNPFNSVTSILGSHVSQALKDKIWNGEFVHLNKLLLQEPCTEMQNQIVFDGGVFQVKPKNKETKIANFSQWMDAFFIYASIYLEKHPLQAISLFRYMSTIKRGAASNNSGWLDYDVQFRLKKSVDSSLNWGSIDAELWLFYMQTVNKTQLSNQSTRRYLKCYAYNYEGVCQKQYCKYLHQCISCNAYHPSINCFKNNQSSQIPKNAPARSENFNSNNKFFRNRQQTTGRQTYM